MTEGFQDFQSNSPGQEMSGPTCLLCNDAIERRIGLAGLGICLLCELDLRRGHLRGVVWTSGSGQRCGQRGIRTKAAPGPCRLLARSIPISLIFSTTLQCRGSHL